MYRYVKVDSEGLPVEDFWYQEEIEEEGKIPIPTDFNLSNKKYSNGKWVDIVPIPSWEADLIDETIEAQLEERMNIQYLVDLTEINTEEE